MLAFGDLLCVRAVQLAGGVALPAAGKPHGAGKHLMLKWLIHEVQQHWATLPASGPGSDGGPNLHGRVTNVDWWQRVKPQAGTGPAMNIDGTLQHVCGWSLHIEGTYTPCVRYVLCQQCKGTLNSVSCLGL